MWYVWGFLLSYVLLLDNMNSGGLEWAFLPKFSVNLNMVYPLHIVVGMKKPCPSPTIGTDRAQSRTLYTSILARVVMDFKCTFKKINI